MCYSLSNDPYKLEKGGVQMIKNLAKHSFAAMDLRKEIKTDDFWRFGLNISGKDKVQALMVDYSKKIADRDYQVDNIRIVKQSDGKLLFIIDDHENNLLIRRANKILREFVSQAIFSRNEEISQLKTIIATEENSIIFRTDITSFYENINFEKVLNKLYDDGYNNLPSLKVLQSIYKFCNDHQYRGLPRGLSISATLADYYMRDFDKNVFALDTCFYYSRYVDDIIVIFTDENKKVKKALFKILPSGLTLNANKTIQKRIGDADQLDYLGYSIDLKDGVTKISKKKMKKTKTRLAKSIVAFNFNKNFELLLKRISLLSCNTRMRMSGREKPVISGFRFLYSLCNEEAILEQMKELDCYFHNLINAKKYKPSCMLRKLLKPNEFEKLKSFSFKEGYKEKIMCKLSRLEISEVKQVWKYE